MGIRKTIYGLLNLGAESTVTTQTTAVIQSLSGSLALVPSGSGALTANIPDGTVAGGNARGINSVDLQMSRAGAGQVASSNYAFIGGGQNNYTLSGDHYQVIVGGLSNYINASGHSFIGGGSNNSIFTGGGSGWAVVTGGRSNTANSQYAAVSGGQSNTASTNSHATVVGGQGNTSSGQHSISGGQTNTSSSSRTIALGEQNTSSGLATVAIGRLNVANATYSVAIGNRNQATGIASLALGSLGNSYLFGQNSFGNGISALGDCQSSDILPYKDATLTTGATTTLFLDGSSLLITPNGSNRTWNTTVNWVATVTGSSGTTTGVTVGDSIYGVSEFGFKKISGVASITPLIRDSIVADTAIMETATLTYATGSSNSLAMTFTAPTFAGGGSLGIRVVAKVSLVELAW